MGEYGVRYNGVYLLYLNQRGYGSSELCNRFSAGFPGIAPKWKDLVWISSLSRFGRLPGWIAPKWRDLVWISSLWPVTGLDLLVSAGFPGIAPRFDAKNNDFPRIFYGDTVCSKSWFCAASVVLSYSTNEQFGAGDGCFLPNVARWLAAR